MMSAASFSALVSVRFLFLSTSLLLGLNTRNFGGAQAQLGRRVMIVLVVAPRESLTGG